MITIPITAVMSPPVRNEMTRGARLLKSFAGDTTLAARLVVIVATVSAIIDSTTVNGPPILPSSSTGSQITLPPGNTSTVADVTATPMNAYSVIVGGNP